MTRDQLQGFLPLGVAHSHERRMFEQLRKVLAAGFGSGRDQVYRLGNARLEDQEWI